MESLDFGGILNHAFASSVIYQLSYAAKPSGIRIFYLGIDDINIIP